MRPLLPLALAALAAFPLSAHGYWRRPHRVVIVQEDACRDAYRRWDGDRWEGRAPVYRHGYFRDDDRRYDCDDDRVVLRPLPRPLVPPFQGRLELWLH
ncbi:hypothetical protein [Geothrix fuzhouensis]|uniref:hypothetical protein n=1 Tax=Geothrix fuzhouensis TaxID=2966451 RepID=UPI002148B0A2|nr:hypothetical protein [Geothrix fuzhouensis]